MKFLAHQSKFHIFWEGHKILWYLHLTFDYITIKSNEPYQPILKIWILNFLIFSTKSIVFGWKKQSIAKPKKSFKLVSLIKKFVKNQIRKIARNSVIHLILFLSFRRSCVRRPDEIFPQMVSTLKERP